MLNARRPSWAPALFRGGDEVRPEIQSAAAPFPKRGASISFEPVARSADLLHTLIIFFTNRTRGRWRFFNPLKALRGVSSIRGGPVM